MSQAEMWNNVHSSRTVNNVRISPVKQPLKSLMSVYASWDILGLIITKAFCISAAGLMLFLKQLDWTLIWLAGSSTGETVAAMSRRSRNSRAWRYVWGDIRRDADARALVLASENEDWSYDRLEVSIQEVLFSPGPTALNRVSHHEKAKFTTGSCVKFKAADLPLAVINSVLLLTLLLDARGWIFSGNHEFDTMSAFYRKYVGMLPSFFVHSHHLQVTCCYISNTADI